MALKTEQLIKILQLKGLGRKSAFQFCNISLEEVFSTNQELIDFLRISIAKKLVKRLTEYSEQEYLEAFEKAEKIIEYSEKENIKFVSYYDTHFPKSLKDIKNPPIVLNFKGDIKVLNTIESIAIIGTRKPTIEGVKSGEYFGEIFGKEGFNVVSGLAIGCDSSAHRGCLKVKGITTAILAHGLHTIYPKENSELAEEILNKGGVLLSEYFFGTGASPNNFIERDRLQAGLSIATIVIQTAIKGGTMHAVNETLDSSKILSAVKYKNDLNSDKILGNIMLIEQKKAFPLEFDNYNELIGLINSETQTSNFNKSSNNNTKKENDSEQFKLDF